ncbi:MAG: RNA methyltransferase [Chitinophagales bacterium]|nr:RNA methyltransferase [Chitinophagales bacterium]
MSEFPENFLNNIHSAAGFNAETFIKAHDENAPVSIRINPKKNYCEFEKDAQVAWCENAMFLKERPVFTLDPLLHAGCYYVQEASSMFSGFAVQHCMDLNKPIKVLDLCAAPGGKSTDIISILSPESILVSNELVKQRVQILKENMLKWGYENEIITHNEAKHFSALPQYFDAILIDAPCSGSGLFRKDAHAMQHWNLNNLQMCSQRQEKILEDVLPALKENGILIYSTCSYSIEEDENITDLLINKYGFQSIAIPILADWNIIEVNTPAGGIGYRFYPDKVKGEGFYISVLRNTKAIENNQLYKTKESLIQDVTPTEKSIVSEWINDIALHDFFKINNTIIALPKNILAEIKLLATKLLVLQSGIALGEIKGKDFIPAHAFAMSSLLKDTIPKFELDKKSALQYLRKQEIHLTGDFKGWAIVCYKNQSLGWIKKLPNRINNYYPAEYRIRM